MICEFCGTHPRFIGTEYGAICRTRIEVCVEIVALKAGRKIHTKSTSNNYANKCERMRKTYKERQGA